MKRCIKWLLRSSPFTPSGLVARAVILFLAFVLLHAMGFRHYTTVLSGTSPTGGPVGMFEVIVATTYMVSYFGVTVAAPILLIASLVLNLLQRLYGASHEQNDDGDEKPLASEEGSSVSP